MGGSIQGSGACYELESLFRRCRPSAHFRPLQRQFNIHSQLHKYMKTHVAADNTRAVMLTMSFCKACQAAAPA